MIGIVIPEAARVEIASELGGLLADTHTLYLETHNHHRNVTGPMVPSANEMLVRQRRFGPC